ncbi:MAG: tetratricopeptide repeat protein [Bacteroidales bacterium]
MKYIILSIAILFLTIPFTGNAQVQNRSSQQNTRLQKKQKEERLASTHYRNREYEKAAEIYGDLYKKETSHYYYTYLLYCLLQLNDFDEAEKIAKKQSRKHRDRLKYLVDLGYVYQRAGDPEKAEKEFNAAIENIPANVYLIKDLANAFYLRGQNKKAIETYLKGRNILDNENAFHFELANLYRLTGSYDLMMKELLDQVEEDPGSLDRVQNRLQSRLHEDTEGELTGKLWKALLKRNQKDPGNVAYAEMLLWMSVQQQDFEFALTQAISLDKRYNEDGGRIFDLARLCINNKDYEAAVKSFQYILDKGEHNIYYLPATIGLLKSKYLRITSGYEYEEKELARLENEYHKALDLYGRFPETIELMRDLAHLDAFYLDKFDEAIEILNEAVEIPNAPPKQVAECKLELADIFLFIGEVWEATLLYSQVEKAFKHEPTGHEAKLKNARLAYYIGEFEWAIAQLDVLKSATSKLIANDAMDIALLIADNKDADSNMAGLKYFARAELLMYQNKNERALQTLDSIYSVNLFHPLFDEILFKKSEIMMKAGEYMKADSLLNHLVTNFTYDILADDALFMRADLHENILHNPEKARELYQQILLNYPGSLYAVEARKRFRQLRGDDI